MAIDKIKSKDKRQIWGKYNVQDRKINKNNNKQKGFVNGQEGDK